jgi:hypothetical protein
MMTGDRIRLATIFVFAFLMLFSVTPAYSNNAEHVQIAGAVLSASDPYWKNGGGGSADDWNLFFDTSTGVPTLNMKDAVLNDVLSDGEMMLIDGDVALELHGRNTLTYSEDQPVSTMGINVLGSLWIAGGPGDGAGSLILRMSNTDLGVVSYHMDGIRVDDALTVTSGNIDIALDSKCGAGGIQGKELFISGGNIELYSKGTSSMTISVYLFTMSGGAVSATADAAQTWDSFAIQFRNARIYGGFGRFETKVSGIGAQWGINGQILDNSQFFVLGGRMIFTGPISALYFATEKTLTPYTNGYIMVSSRATGEEKTRWDASMHALAMTDAQESFLAMNNYMYVEIIGADRLTP